MRKGWLLGIVFCLCLGIGGLSADAPASVGRALLGTGFTYQGRLTDGGSPANGNYDLQFRLYDNSTAGNQIGTTVSVNGIAITDGLFTTLFRFWDDGLPGAGTLARNCCPPPGVVAIRHSIHVNP